MKLNLHQLLAERPCWIHMICQSQKVLCGLPKDGNSPLSLLSRYSAAWSRVAILIAGIGRTEERRSGVRARPLLTGKACLVAGRAAAQLPQLSQLPPLLARPGHQLPPATEERAQQFGACPNLGIISRNPKMDFAAGLKLLEIQRPTQRERSN